MKKFIPLTAIFILGLFAFACGGSTETKENETKQVSTTPNSNVVLTNTAAVNTTFKSNDADDLRSVNANTAGKTDKDDKTRKDADDLRQGNTNRKQLDRDDVNGRRDTDDNGKRDRDGDDDDN